MGVWLLEPASELQDLGLALNPALLLVSLRYLEQSPLPLDAFESSSVGEDCTRHVARHSGDWYKYLLQPGNKGHLDRKRLTMESAGLSSTSGGAFHRHGHSVLSSPWKGGRVLGVSPGSVCSVCCSGD